MPLKNMIKYNHPDLKKYFACFPLYYFLDPKDVDLYITPWDN